MTEVVFDGAAADRAAFDGWWKERHPLDRDTAMTGAHRELALDAWLGARRTPRAMSVQPFSHMSCCPVCKTVATEDSDQYFLRVAVEIGWFNSGGGSPSGVTIDGLCGSCGDRIFNRVANVLRVEVGEPELTEAAEPALLELAE